MDYTTMDKARKKKFKKNIAHAQIHYIEYNYILVKKRRFFF
jgi:hypothetical protein